jgi:hypothetical protein
MGRGFGNNGTRDTHHGGGISAKHEIQSIHFGGAVEGMACEATAFLEVLVRSKSDQLYFDTTSNWAD